MNTKVTTRNGMLLRAIGVICSGFVLFSLEAGDWYVAENGSDSAAGTSAEPFASIAHAVSIAAEQGGGTVHVAEGTYTVAQEAVISAAVVVEASGERAKTIVKKMNNKARPFTLDHEGACVRGLTIASGATSAGYCGPGDGGAIYLKKGLVDKCDIYLCTSASTKLGGGIYMEGGMVSRSEIRNCQVYGGKFGAGVYMKGGTLDNCLVHDNGLVRDVGNGSGVAMFGEDCAVINCTIVGNKSTTGGALYRSKNCGIVCNTLVIGNSVKTSGEPNIVYLLDPEETAEDVFKNCCSSTKIGLNAQETSGVPYDEAFRLVPEKADCCINKGDNQYVRCALDFFGGSRIYNNNIVDIGAHEVQSETVTLSISLLSPTGVDSCSPTMRAVLLGGDISKYTCDWYFDGSSSVGATGAVVTPTFTTVGKHSVCVRVMDGATLFIEKDLGECVTVLPSEILVGEDMDINEALSLAYMDGQTVKVPKGIHSVTQQVTLAAGVKIVGVDGFDSAVLKRPNRAFRGSFIVMTSPDAELRNVSIEGDDERYATYVGDGGGINMVAGRVERCVVRNCTVGSGGKGGGIWMSGGCVTRSVVTNNMARADSSNGAGVYMTGGRLDNTLVRDNRPYAEDMGGHGAVFVFGVDALVANCIVVDNANKHTGGVFRQKGKVVNSIIRGNTLLSGDASDVGYALGATEDINDVFIANCTPVSVGAQCITNAPRFINEATGDYHISVDSPCRYKGLYEPWMSGVMDFFGGCRANGRHVDIGYYQTPPNGLLIFVR